MDFHALLAEFDQSLTLNGLALGQPLAERVAARHLNLRLLGIVERIPGLPVQQQLEDRRLLVPAGEVVVLRHLVEAEIEVDCRHRVFSRVDRTALERREDVAAGDELGRDAHLLHNLGAQTEEAHLQALEVFDGLYLLAEPARRFGRDNAAGYRFQTVLLVYLIPELIAAAEEDPAHILSGAGAEGDGREHRESRLLTVPVTGRRPARIDRTRRNGVEALLGRDQRIGLEELDFDVAAGNPLQTVDHVFAHRAELGHIAREPTRHFPAYALRGIRITDTRRHQRDAQRTDHKSDHRKFPDRHLQLPPLWFRRIPYHPSGPFPLQRRCPLRFYFIIKLL